MALVGHSGLDFIFLDSVLLRFLLICWIFLLIGFLLCGFGAKSGVFWRLSQDSVFRCNLKGIFLTLIYTIFGNLAETG